MATNLVLCQMLHQDVGVAGAIPTVIDQIGMLKRVVDYVNKANRKIQRRKTNWNFLWAEWDLTLVIDQSEYPPPDGIGAFDQTSFWVKAGTVNARQLTYIDYKEWRDFYQHMYTDSNESAFVTIKPNGNIAVLPAPDSADAGSVMTADYWKAPVDLTADAQVSLIPEQFHDCIVSLAKVYFAEKAHDTGLYNSAYIEHEQTYKELKAHSLPGQAEERKSESSIPKVIEVM
jgi:hypothetical protein